MRGRFSLVGLRRAAVREVPPSVLAVKFESLQDLEDCSIDYCSVPFTVADSNFRFALPFDASIIVVKMCDAWPGGLVVGSFGPRLFSTFSGFSAVPGVGSGVRNDSLVLQSEELVRLISWGLYQV